MVEEEAPTATSDRRGAIISRALGAFAGATEEIRLASGVALTPFYDAVRLAEDAATVDALGEDVHFVFRPYAPGIETEELLERIGRLSEEVAPRL